MMASLIQCSVDLDQGGAISFHLEEMALKRGLRCREMGNWRLLEGLLPPEQHLASSAQDLDQGPGPL